jgi:hypothetical protein
MISVFTAFWTPNEMLRRERERERRILEKSTYQQGLVSREREIERERERERERGKGTKSLYLSIVHLQVPPSPPPKKKICISFCFLRGAHMKLHYSKVTFSLRSHGFFGPKEIFSSPPVTHKFNLSKNQNLIRLQAECITLMLKQTAGTQVKFFWPPKQKFSIFTCRSLAISVFLFCFFVFTVPARPLPQGPWSFWAEIFSFSTYKP